MNSSDIQRKVFESISKVMEIPIEQIDENSSSDTIEAWDSMTQMALTLSLEEEFQIRFASSQAPRLSNVKVIVSAIEELRKAK